MNINVGDTVQIVKPTPCCNSKKHIGEIFVVRRVSTENGDCIGCGAAADGITVAWGRVDTHPTDVRRLRKYGPLTAEEATYGELYEEWR